MTVEYQREVRLSTIRARELRVGEVFKRDPDDDYSGDVRPSWLVVESIGDNGLLITAKNWLNLTYQFYPGPHDLVTVQWKYG